MTTRIARFHSCAPVMAAVLLALLLTTLALASPAQAKKVSPKFFGMHDSQVASGDAPGVKSGAIRLWDTGTSWREIEVKPGEFDWSHVDSAVATARAHGLRPLLVLGQTPQFHARNPHVQGSYGPGATSMPRLRAWKRYVGAVAHRYGTLIDYQVWNEPNVIGYWSGTQAEMATLTATASKKITGVLGRRATIVAPSFPLRLKAQQKWFTKYWQQTVGGRSLSQYVDAVSANLYPLENQAPEAELPLIKFVNHALPKAARRKPLWNTEINFGLRGGPAAKMISDATQAAYVARTLVLNGAGPVSRVYWYAWDVGPIANTHLRAADGQLTRAGLAWNVTHDWMVGTKARGCQRATRGKLAGVYTCTVSPSRREVRRIYWKPSGHAVRVTTAKSTRFWSDLSGQYTRHSGALHLRVGRLPVMVSSRR